jgi:hypothetical protein
VAGVAQVGANARARLKWGVHVFILLKENYSLFLRFSTACFALFSLIS